MQLMKWGFKTYGRKFAACMTALIMCFTMLGLGNPGLVSAKTETSEPADHFEVWLVDPADTSKKIQLLSYTIAELNQLPQVERAYSSIDSFPAPVFTAARGIDLIELLQGLKFDMDSVERFKFRATDFDADNYPSTFGKVLQASVLLDSDRYYFPKIQECWDEYWDETGENPSQSGIGNFREGSDPYTRAEQSLIRPMLALESFQARAIASDVGKTVYLQPQFDLMDGLDTLRLCYGQKYPGECITMNFLRWTYKMEVSGKLLPISLSADTSYNRVGKPIEIGFPDNIAWQNGITAVSVDDKLLDESQYTVAPGKITIGATVFTETGTYTVKVSSGFQDSTVLQEITEASASDPLTPPELTADTSNNTVGNSIEITFTENESWRNAITEVKTGETVLESGKYTKEAGKITIDDSVFAVAGLYTIVIKAAGYEDASLQQQIAENMPEQASLQSIEITKPAAKLLYTQGETLDISGLEVTGHYSDGISKPEAISPANITGFDSSTPAARQVLTISLGGKTVSYEISVLQAITTTGNETINISPNIPVNISIPEGVTSTAIAVYQNMALPIVRVESAQVDMIIPNGTTLTGSETLQLPEVKPSSSVKVAGAKAVNLVIELGSPTGTISFSKPVLLMLKGQGAKTAGFIDNTGKFQKINKLSALSDCDRDSDAEAVAMILENAGMQEASGVSGQDLVIWTKHFTTFVAYTPSSTDTPVVVVPRTFLDDEFITYESAVKKQTISSRGGTIKIAEAKFYFPANAISNDIEVSIRKLGSDIPSIPSGFKLLGEVHEISSDKTCEFARPFTVTLPFSRDKVDSDKYDLGIYCWNDKEWVILEQVKVDMTSEKVSGEAANLGKFAVLLAEKEQTPLEEQKKPAPAAAPTLKSSLNDITGHWAEANIRQLVNSGVISGYPDATFKPDKSITRAEFVAALVKALKLEIKRGRVFSDTTGHWAQDSISTAVASGMVSGYDEFYFGPDDVISREQMAVIISRALGLSTQEGIFFADSKQIADWAATAVAAASGKNIISGFPGNTFQPRENASRAEAVTVIVKALNAVKTAAKS